MKLNVLFIVMDLLTVLAYPIVLVHGKLHQFLRTEKRIPPVSLLIPVPVKSGR